MIFPQRYGESVALWQTVDFERIFSPGRESLVNNSFVSYYQPLHHTCMRLSLGSFLED